MDNQINEYLQTLGILWKPDWEICKRFFNLINEWISNQFLKCKKKKQYIIHK